MHCISKALIITPFYGHPGGAETFAENLFEELSKKYKVDIATLSYDKPWQGQNIMQGLWVAYKLLPIVRRFTRYTQYDKIYALGLISSGVARLLCLKYSSIMLALYDFKKEDIKVKWALGKAEKIFVEGWGGVQDMVKAGLPGKPGQPILQPFQHWVNDKFVPIDREKNEILKVLFVGRPIKIKGKEIIEGVEKILMERVNFKYVENVPYKDLPKYYQMADICVVPSLYSEGFSRVVAEAMSCGCVVIASNKGSLPEMIKEAGICLDPTIINFTAAIESFNLNRKQLAKWCKESIKYAKINFSTKNAEVFL